MIGGHRGASAVVDPRSAHPSVGTWEADRSRRTPRERPRADAAPRPTSAVVAMGWAVVAVVTVLWGVFLLRHPWLLASLVAMTLGAVGRMMPADRAHPPGS
jgi:hypothetical protein